MNYPPKPKKVAYVVLVGRMPGIYTSWPETHKLVEHFEGAVFKGYETYEEAIKVWDAWEERGENLIRPPKNKHGHRFKCAQSMPHQAPRRADPAVERRAYMLVRDHGAGDGSGSKTTACSSVTCRYPACQC